MKVAHFVKKLPKDSETVQTLIVTSIFKVQFLTLLWEYR
jgi:hypothetical protein